MKLNVVFTLKIINGEYEYKNNSTHTIEVANKNDKESINNYGEEIAKRFYSDFTEQVNDWYYFHGGCVAVRYQSYEIIKDEATFKVIEQILYK